MKVIQVLAVIFLGFLLGCQNPAAHSTEASSSPVLTVSWGGNSGVSKTIMPSASDLSVGSYNVILHPSSGADITHTVGLSTTSYSFTNVGAQAYTVTVNGVVNNDGTGAVILTGSGSVNLSTTSTASVNVGLSYVSTSGAGSFQLTMDFSGVSTSGTPSSVGVTYLSPGAGITATDTMSAAPWIYTNIGNAGNWQVLVTATTNSGKVARKMESVVVAQNVTTHGTLAFTDADFSAAYLPVTGLSLNNAAATPTTGTSLTASLLVNGNMTFTPVWTGTNTSPSNQLVKWTLTNNDGTNTTTNVYATLSGGTVTALKAGQGKYVTVTATSVDGGYSASCSVYISPITPTITQGSSIGLPWGGNTQTLSVTNVGLNGVTWSSNNSSVVTVSSTGLLTTTSSGFSSALAQTGFYTATITATSVDDTSKTATCSVVVTPYVMYVCDSSAKKYYVYLIDAATGALYLEQTISPSNTPLGITITPDGKHFYGGFSSATIWCFNIDSLTGKLNAKGSAGASDIKSLVATNSYVYGITGADDKVYCWPIINGGPFDGTIGTGGPRSFDYWPRQIAIYNDYLYVRYTNGGTRAMDVYTGAATASLFFLKDINVGVGTLGSFALSSDGQFIYYADSSGNSGAAMDPITTGVPSGYMSGTQCIGIQGAGNFQWIGVDPTGTSNCVYLANSTNLSCYTTSGTLSLSSSYISAGTASPPACVVWDPTGKWVYTCNRGLFSAGLKCYANGSTTVVATYPGVSPYDIVTLDLSNP